MSQVRDMQRESDERFYAFEERRQREQHEFELKRQRQLAEEAAKRQEFFADLIKEAMTVLGQSCTS